MAQEAPTADAGVPTLPIERHTLPNGLEVIVSTDRSTPIVAVNVWYGVGSAHEESGRSGFAHLFEHMLFEETEQLEDGELDRIISEAGGILGGRTNTDRTEYTELVPANRLNLALWSHAERMRRLVISRENFERQREVVKEERRLRIDNTPYGAAQVTADTLSQDYGPYQHSVIGSMAELDAARVEEVRDFYDRHYQPNNAVIVVVGDTSMEEVRPLIEEYFGAFPRGPIPARLPEPPPVPRTDGERRAVIEDRLAQLPLVYVIYTMPGAGHPDSGALEVLNQILGSGESSRLSRRLVQEERAAAQILGQLQMRRGPGLMLLAGLANGGVDPAQVETLLHEETARIAAEGVTRAEVDRAVNQLRAIRVAELVTVAGKAAAVQVARSTWGDPAAVNRAIDRVAAVTPEDVQRVAARFLVPENRTVVIAVPAAFGAANRSPDRDLPAAAGESR